MKKNQLEFLKLLKVDFKRENQERVSNRVLQKPKDHLQIITKVLDILQNTTQQESKKKNLLKNLENLKNKGKDRGKYKQSYKRMKKETNF